MKKTNIKLIAETAWHHDGDYEFMMDLVDTIDKKSKAEIIKLHLSLDLNEYMMPDHPNFTLLTEKAFTEAQWHHIISKVLESGKELMLLLNDSRAVQFGAQFQPSFVEIHSVCLNDIHLLNKLKECLSEQTRVVLGVGGSTLYEIEHAISVLDTNNIVMMHGFQNYPTNYEDINFARIRKVMALYPDYEHGYADHTAWNEPNNTLITCMGAALGMNYIEKHITTVPGQERIDWQAAIGIEEFNNIAKYLQVLNKCEGNGMLELNKGERDYSVIGLMKKAAFLNKPLSKGATLTIQDISFKRTSQTADVSQTEALQLIGKQTNTDLEPNTLITKKMFS